MRTTYKMAIQASRKLGFAALLVGLAGWAVAQKSNEKVEAVKRQDQVWRFTGSAADDPTNENLYELYTGNVNSLCPAPEGAVCAIVAPAESGKPDISEDLENEIMSGEKTTHVFRKSN